MHNYSIKKCSKYPSAHFLNKNPSKSKSTDWLWARFI